ncbi:MAG: hypothetical protein UX35_C0003G0051 [Microgenomates group bacterium GW2011_GWA1_46_15]|nr:MAG: hypothetical protein UX00_C0004G0087 [Microgenomates group bacterium GW2011_GWB1_45_17]KKU23915.1 MAG: hypothetical protein UX35_C0003G0051 [Microgenomates group bacterium GW2011_GWA1_46_15]KKU24692.1 MAG: hypothetical protein UX36_C0001G0309 [Microgenomates group bacterium GW2011_GWC1_46_15]
MRLIKIFYLIIFILLLYLFSYKKEVFAGWSCASSVRIDYFYCDGSKDITGACYPPTYLWESVFGCDTSDPSCPTILDICSSNDSCSGSSCTTCSESPSNCWVQTCDPVCNSPLCGQPDGCGSSCSNASAGTGWTDTGNRTCGGGCGNQSCSKEQIDTCGNYQWVADGSTCNECLNIGAWGACSSATFQRTRTCSDSCGGCGGVSQAENCLGTISGTYFDATDFTCPQMALAPKVSGGTTQMDSTLYAPPITYTATTNSNGVYTQSVRSPETYALSETVPAGTGFLAIPRYICTSNIVSFTGQGEAATRDYGWWKSVPAWFQLMGGNMGAEASSGVAIQTYVPSSCVGSPCAPRAILAKDTAGTTGSSGWVAVGPSASIVTTTGASTLANLNEEGTNVYAQSARAARRENYGEFYRRFSLGFDPSTLSNTPLGGVGGITLGNLAKPDPIGSPPARGAYYAPGDTTIASAWSVASTEKIVIFVNGNLTIAAPITVAQGGFLAFITTSNITIDSSVGTSDTTSTTPQVEGVYIANGTFTVASKGVKQGDLKFVGAGTFVGWTGVSLNRDFRLGDDTTEGLKNFDEPGELFLARPDFVVNLPRKMARPVIDWQEVAP